MPYKQSKILIVDDDRANLEVLVRILNPKYMQSTGTCIASINENYTLCLAKSGQAALRMVMEEKPDLILLDVIMPDMSGFDVLAALKESDETYDIPVIFITGLDSVENEEKGFLMGAVDYITKPFHNSIVRARVKTQLRTVEQMRTIEMLGLTDTLTNLPNRRGFDNQITTEWSRAIRGKNYISLLMIDIDNFKGINDKYGHQQGDIVLQAVARWLAFTHKRSSDFAARWGGEEFSVILPNTDMTGALEVAEEIRSSIEMMDELSICGKHKLNITISIGVASTKPNISDTIEEFIAQADAALYTAKVTGRNCVCS